MKSWELKRRRRKRRRRRRRMGMMSSKYDKIREILTRCRKKEREMSALLNTRIRRSSNGNAIVLCTVLLFEDTHYLLYSIFKQKYRSSF